MIGTRIDPRLLVSFGFLITAATLHIMTVIYQGIDFQTIVLLRMLQVIGLPLIFIPISTLNYIGVPREKNNQVSGLSNFARNIGGSIGTALLSTFLARQAQIHQNTFAAHTGHANANFQNLLNQLTGAFTAQGYDAVTAAKKALLQVYGMAQAQASVLGFENAFWVMSVTILCLVPFPFIMRRPPAGQGRGMGGH